jgi:CRP-like cAMP-binding protein
MQTHEAVPTANRAWQPSNLLLRALPANELSSLRPHVATLSLGRGSVLVDENEPLTQVYFVEAGVITLLAVLEHRSAAAVAAVGREGAIGLITLLLGGETALGRYEVLMPVSVLAVEVSRFRSVLEESPTLRAACEAFAQALLFQTLQAVPCGRLHTVEQRCARWLLMCDDRGNGDTFELTQESLAGILGVPLPTVAATISKLQRGGLISYRRDALTVIDRSRLEATACGCYRIVYDRLQGLLAPPFG